MPQRDRPSAWTAMRSVWLQRFCMTLSSVLATCSVAQRSAAHAPPQVLAASFATDGADAVLITNRGLIFGDVDGGSWRLMCNEALGINSFERPDVAYLPNGSLLAATSGGLKRSDDGGCSWQLAEAFGASSAPALSQHDGDPATLYLAVFGADVGGLYVSHDAAASWSRLLEVADNDFIEEIVLAGPDRAQIHASGQVFDDMGNVTHYVTRSRDAGISFERFEVALLDNEADLTLLAVSPVNPDLLLARALDNSASTSSRMDRLLLSHDGGRTFASVLAVDTLFDARFGVDGSTAWAAGLAGLWRSVDSAATFVQIPGPERMTCVIERAGALWGCGWYAAGADGIGTSIDSGDAFTSLMAFTDVTAPVACDVQAPTTTLCQVLWRDWQVEILTPRDAGSSPVPGSDAGIDASRPDAASAAPDAAAAGASAPRDATGGGCTVRSVTEHAPIDVLALVFAALVRLGLRRRRRTSAAP
jgi:hypothetical protein